jgi:hypothetical protein
MFGCVCASAGAQLVFFEVRMVLMGRSQSTLASHTSPLTKTLSKSNPKEKRTQHQEIHQATNEQQIIQARSMGHKLSRDRHTTATAAASSSGSHEHEVRISTNMPPHSNVGAWNAVYKNDDDGHDKFLRDHTTVQARKDVYKDLKDIDAKIEYAS